ncbi:hypothetical protein BC936DRAFT_149799 [Jimgerdemannia flammicorona]|uniref:NADAR domain-containing protein n=1 Tax=Jimgerdemannia flammicorona TaxID=994334 RepID=A0A433DJT8_9FUNG|nr:hypothetical protein BC936DRAFT_149799 [Jimgerdemannia flammicorona]
MSSVDTIEFYGANKAYGFFSNFYNAPIYIEGVRYDTTEHYFQAMKFPQEPDYQRAIATADGPGKAAKLGRSRAHKLRSDWEEIKDEVMTTAVRAKFTSHEDLRKQMLQTGNAKLVEASPTDAYWGVGADNNGKNMLGIVLMRVRDELAAAQQD